MQHAWKHVERPGGSHTALDGKKRPRLQHGVNRMPRGLTSTEKPVDSLAFGMERPTPIKDAAVHRLAKSITQLTLCQVTTSEVDDATKLLEKARQKLQGIQNIPSQRVNDLDAAIRQLRQIGYILDSCTISASYEVTQAQKAILQLDHTARGLARALAQWCSPQPQFEADAGKKTTEHQAFQHSWQCTRITLASMMIGKALLSGL